jgi:type IV pilus assembly protein PilA
MARRVDNFHPCVEFATRRGWTLLELLLVVTVLGVIAAVILPRFSNNATTAKKTACYTLKGRLEVQAQLWRRNKGTWPNPTLSDLAADKNYLPEGLPVCPVDGSAYAFDPVTHRISGHVH